MRILAVLFFILGVALPLSAQDLADYDPLSDEWHGLRDFVGAAETLGIQVEIASTLDLASLDENSRLVVVYPQAPMNGQELGLWLSDGGRMLLFDDFGTSEQLLERLEITRVVPSEGNFPHGEFADGRFAFPVFSPLGRHPLLEGVGRVVANHPAVLTNPGGAVIGYEAGGALVYDMNLGSGKAIVVADSSLVINQMLESADNLIFARNALSYVCDSAPNCVVTLLTGEFEVSGTYRGEPTIGAEDVGDTISALNEAIEKAMRTILGELLFYMSILLVIGIGAYLLTILPMRPTRAYSAYVSDFFAKIPNPQSEFDWNISRFGRGARAANHALPMSILKETFEELFLKEMGYWGSKATERPGIENIADAFTQRYLERFPEPKKKALRSATLELLALMATIPPRNRVFLDSDAHFTQADLLKAHRRVRETLTLMGIDNEYIRRASGDF